MPTATLEGRPILASSDVVWSLLEGVKPYKATFDMVPEDAEELAKLGRPVTLKIDKDEYKFLYVLYVTPSDNPQIRKVTVADRRIWWSYKIIRRDYNVRRNVGFKRVNTPAGDLPKEIEPTTEQIEYAVWSLRTGIFSSGSTPGTKWAANDVLTDVVNAASIPEKNAFGAVPGISFEGKLQATLITFPIEQLAIRERGDQCIQRCLKYLPQAGVYITKDGDVRFYSKVTGKEKDMITLADAKMVGQGDVQFISNANVRPSEVHVLFEYEPEWRVDYLEQNTATTTNDTRYCENVLPLPDYQLTIGGKTYVQGTWITFDEAFTAWGNPPNSSGPLTHDRVQKAMIPYNGLWEPLELRGMMTVNADWAARIAAVKTHYRRTFRIQKHWMDRIRALKPYRVATLNPAKGTRAPAIAYSDYSFVGGQRLYFNEALAAGVNIHDGSYASNVKGHPAIPKKGDAPDKALDSNSKAAPARVTIVDSDQGIFHVDYQLDLFQVFEAVMPSMITLSDQEDNIDGQGRPNIPGPTEDFTQRGRPISWDAISRRHIGSLPKLTKNYVLSMICVALPGSPNSEAGFFRIKVEPSDIGDIVPPNAVTAGKAPIMEVYIGPGTETARVAWNDANKGNIEKIYGVGANTDQSQTIAPLVLNFKQSSDSGGASLWAIARDAAARIYTSLSDRYQGEMSGDMNSALSPAGWLSQVVHTLAKDGVMSSHLVLPERLEPLDIFTFLDSSTRNLILKIADPGRSA